MNRIEDEEMTHNLINADERVHQRILATLDSKISTWRDGT